MKKLIIGVGIVSILASCNNSYIDVKDKEGIILEKKYDKLTKNYNIKVAYSEYRTEFETKDKNLKNFDINKDTYTIEFVTDNSTNTSYIRKKGNK